MKILSAKQIKEADQITIKNQQISSLELMERTANLAYSHIVKDFRDDSPVFKIFCGIGNNGGDGLVIARKLLEAGYETAVFIVDFNPKHASDFTENLSQLKQQPGNRIYFLNVGSDFPEINSEDVVIDVIFGIGLNRKLPDWVGRLIEYINECKSLAVYSIDVPSGMSSDQFLGNPIIKASQTLTFQQPKLPFYLARTAEYTGEITVINIGLDQSFLNGLNPVGEVITEKIILEIRRKRPRFSHKGTYGHCLVVGGSYGKMGSMQLACEAAMRVGAGKLTALIPRCGYEIMQIGIPEAMTLTGVGRNRLYAFEKPDFVPETVCFGMGAGASEETADFFLDLIKFTEKPMLIDADGLNLLSKHEVLLEFIPEHSVLTPHPKELERLIGKWDNDFDKLEKVKEFSKRYKLVVVVKDAVTMTVFEDRIFVNSTGNQGMATAGSGDVLSGVIAGLMAQGYPSIEAAVFGVYVHGKAGDIGVEKSSFEVLIARDIIHNFATAFRELDESAENLNAKR